MHNIIKVFISTIVLSVITLFIITGCEKDEKEVLNVGISPWPGYEPLVLGVEKGFYENVDVRIVRHATPSESFRALRDGIVDVAAFTADEVLHYAEVRDKPKMFLVLDISNGADAIVARPDIKSIEGLKGKRVYVESSALGNYLIKRSMDFAQNINIKDVDVSTVELGKHVKDYKDGKVDALVTYEPFLTQLINEGAHILFDSTQIPQEIVDVVVTNNDTLEKKSELLKELINGWYRTLEYINNNRKTAMAEMAVYEYISADDFESSYEKLIIPSRSETIEMLETDDGSFKNAMHRLSEQMFEKGSLKMEVDIAPLLEPRLVKESR